MAELKLDNIGQPGGPSTAQINAGADGLALLINASTGSSRIALAGAIASMAIEGASVQIGGPPAALLDDALDVFVFGDSGVESARNLFVNDGYGRGGDASIVGAPTYDASYAVLNGANYLQTQASERYQFTILAAVRVRSSLPNKAVTIADTYALDADIDAGVDAGSTKFGTYFTLAQTTSTEPPGTLSVRIGIAKPDPTTPLISYMNPTLAVADVSAWRIVAVVCYGVSARLYDLTAGTSSALANAPASYRRFPAYNNKFRIGSDYSAFANGQEDVACWHHYGRALTYPEMTSVAAKLRADYASAGISL